MSVISDIDFNNIDFATIEDEVPTKQDYSLPKIKNKGKAKSATTSTSTSIPRSVPKSNPKPKKCETSYDKFEKHHLYTAYQRSLKEKGMLYVPHDELHPYADLVVFEQKGELKVKANDFPRFELLK